MTQPENKKPFFLHYWKTLAILIIISYLSFVPSSTFKSIPQFTYSDKITHMFMYMALTFVIIYDFYRRNKVLSNISFFFVCILLPIAIGGAVELIQSVFTLSRSGSWGDWLADILGVLVGWGLSMIFVKSRNRILRKKNKV